MQLERFDPFKNQFNAKNFKERRQDLLIPCMRLKKLIELEENLKINGIFLIKGPPGSGKTTIADLFEFYLNQKENHVKCIKINVNNVHNMEELNNCFIRLEKITLSDLLFKSEKNKITYVIIDEAHEIYGDGITQPFESFWKDMKEVAEGQRKNYIRFLFCAVYSDNRIGGKKLAQSPLVLENKFKGLNFLKFTTEEYDEIIRYYSESSMNLVFPITPEIKNLIYQETTGFPQLTIKTIFYLHSTLNNSKEKSDVKVHEVLYSKRFEKEVIFTLKAFPHKFFGNLKYEELIFLRNIHLKGSIFIESSDSPEFDIAKKMERHGVVYEDTNLEFKFPSFSLSSSYFNYICQDVTQIKIPIYTLKSKSKVELAIMALQRMKFSYLINVSNEKAKKVNNAAVSEDQWVIEFFIALRSMIPNDHPIHSQCSRLIDREFVGEVDLYINDELCQPYEITREGNNVVGHLLRKYMTIYPDFLKEFEKKVTARYRFPNLEKYLVIDFRKGDGFERIKEFVVQNYEGEKMDLGPLLKKDLMRVCYGDFSKIKIYYEEVFLTELNCLP